MTIPAPYQALYRQYQWLVPTRFNIAEACCRRWALSGADARRIAIYTEDDAGNRDIWTYQRLFETANRLSWGLRRMGVGQGDRVAVILPQQGEAAAAHMAIYQLGAICVPLSRRFGALALEQRLCDSAARVAIVDRVSQANLLPVMARCPQLQQLIGVGLADEYTLSWHSLLARQEAVFAPVATLASDPAMLLYTSDARGAPRGALHAHGALIGSLPGFVASQDWFPQPGDVFWSAADWAWAGALLGALLPTLYFGRPIVAACQRCSAERALDLMQRYRVSNALFLPAALSSIMLGVPRPLERYRLNLRCIMSAGDRIDPALHQWCRDALGITPNEVFGQTEMNLVVGNSHRHWPSKPGSMGLPYPGHRVAVIDATGVPLPPGKVGEIALHRYDIHGIPDPALFQGYWRDDIATQARFTGDWCRTGDLGRTDEDGYFWHEGRADAAFAPGEWQDGATYRQD